MIISYLSSKRLRITFNTTYSVVLYDNLTKMFKNPRRLLSNCIHSKSNFNVYKLRHTWIPPEGYNTGIEVYNRVAQKKVPLIFLDKNYVKWYICGPTVYDVSHIGHACSYVRFDIIHRILKDFFNVNPVIALGITDIDDKIIIQAYKKKIDYKLLTKKYELEFFKNLNQLNILPPAFILRVSDHIPEIIEFINEIIKKGKGYLTKDGSVYFENSSCEDNWIMVPPTQESGPLKDGQKCHWDFALWKGAKKNEPFWNSPWGEGRPGWHIECSAMASKIFGSQLDMHGGGVDLIFPHHQNEEFQSCCYHNCKQWVNYWLHTGNLMVDQEKMSKSLQNFISINDFLEQYSSDNFRMFCFMSEYKRGVVYDKKTMELPMHSCDFITRILADCDSYIKGNWLKGNISESLLLKELEDTKNEVIEHLKDDFNTAKCYVSLFQLLKNTSTSLNETPEESAGRSPGAVAAVCQYIKQVLKSFGFEMSSKQDSAVSSDTQKLEFIMNEAVKFRSEVREKAVDATDKQLKQSLFASCDSFRNELQTVGIDIKDGTHKSSWSLVDVKQESKESAKSSG